MEKETLEPLWEIYRELTRKAFEAEKKYKTEEKEEKPYSGLTYIEMNDIRAHASGVLRSIEALSEDKRGAWMRGFEIWQEENGLPPEGEFGCWMPAKKKRQPDAAGLMCLVTAVNPFGQSAVFEAFTGYGQDPKNPWYTLDRTKGDDKQRVFDCWKITAWMPLPEPYQEETENENTERAATDQGTEN